MQELNSGTDLNLAISQLENKQSEEGKILKDQCQLAYEAVKPINLIKSTFREAVASQELKNNLFNISVGLVTGYLSKILLKSTSHRPLKRSIGAFLLIGITYIVTKRPEAVKLLGMKVLKNITDKPDERN